MNHLEGCKILLKILFIKNSVLLISRVSSLICKGIVYRLERKKLVRETHQFEDIVFRLYGNTLHDYTLNFQMIDQ